MIENSHVYNLVKGLSPAEKRFFRIFSKRHIIGDQNKYQLLFKTLNELKNEDNDLIIKALAKHKSKSTFLSAEKNYLFQAILKSLTVFHCEDSYGMKLKNQLQAIEMLFYKGLYKDCLKLILAAEKMATKIENFSLLLDVLNWKKKCLGYSKGLAAASSIRASIFEIIHKIENLEQILDIYYKSYALHINENKLEQSAIQKAFQQLMKSPLLQSEQLALSYTAKIYYYLIFEHYSYAINDNQKELESLEKLTEVFKAFNIYPHEYPLDYISIYNRILALKKYVKPETFYDEIAILRKFTLTSGKRNESIAQRVFIIIATNELEYLLVSHQYKKALQKIEALKIESASFAMPIEPYYLIHFYYLFGLTYFNAGVFSKSIDYINIILNRFSLNDRPAVFIRVEMLKLLNHFELGNLQLVSQICRQLKKKYYKKELLSIIEIDLIKVFTKATDVSGNRALMKGLNKVYTKHTIDASTIIFNKDYMIENYLKWIEAFAARTTLLHLVDQ